MAWPKGKKRPKCDPATRTKLPRKVVAPRQETDLNAMQERFVTEYMIDRDPGAAYLRAGYQVAEPTAANINGRRLLRDSRVMSLINNLEISRIDKTKLDAENTVLRLWHLYMEALRQNELTVAGKMLTELAKIQGIYEKHNKQKRAYSMEDIERLKTELKQSGFDIDSMRPSPN